MFAGKPHVFEAITVHADDIAELPGGRGAGAATRWVCRRIELRHGARHLLGRAVPSRVQLRRDRRHARCATARRCIEEGLFADRAELEASSPICARSCAIRTIGASRGSTAWVPPCRRRHASSRSCATGWSSQVLPYARRAPEGVPHHELRRTIPICRRPRARRRARRHRARASPRRHFRTPLAVRAQGRRQLR